MDKPFIQVQWAKETTRGTPATPMTVKGAMISDFSMDPNIEVTRIKEMRASVAPNFLTVPSVIAGSASMEATLSYEDFPYFIEALFNIATPSGAGPYVRAYTAPGVPALTGANSIRYFTFVWGESTDVYRLSAATLSKINIKASKGEPWTMTAEFLGNVLDGAGALAALSDRVVVPIGGHETLIYVDLVGGTIGTTLLNTTAFSFELDIDTKRMVSQHLGSLYPDALHHPEQWDATLTLELEFNATSKPYVAELIAANPLFQRQVRIKATNATQIAQIDFAGDQDGAPKLFTDNDGVMTVEVKMFGRYNVALGSWMKVSSTSTVATLL